MMYNYRCSGSLHVAETNTNAAEYSRMVAAAVAMPDQRSVMPMTSPSQALQKRRAQWAPEMKSVMAWLPSLVHLALPLVLALGRSVPDPELALLLRHP